MDDSSQVANEPVEGKMPNLADKTCYVIASEFMKESYRMEVMHVDRHILVVMLVCHPLEERLIKNLR